MPVPPTAPTPPTAPRREETRVVHEDAFADPYAWMRDTDDPDLLAYLEAENEHTRARTADLDDLTEAVFADICARTKQTDVSVPAFLRHTDGQAYWYYGRTTEGLDYPRLARRPAQNRDELPLPDDDEEEVLLDVEAAAHGHPFFALGTFDVSPDGRMLAYSFDAAGDERYTLRFVQIASGARVDDDITDVAAGGAWCGNGAYCYLRPDEAWRPDRIFRHVLGAEGEDALVLAEPDERFWLGVDESRDRRHVIASAASKTTSETWLLRADDPDARPVSVAGRRDGVEYDVELLGDDCYLVHNDGALDFALAHAKLDPDWSGSREELVPRERWATIWAGRDGIRLLGIAAYDRALVASYRVEGMDRVALARRLPDGTLGPPVPIRMDQPLFELTADGGEDPDTDRIRITCESMTTPLRVFDYRLDTGERTLLRERPVLDHPTNGAYRSDDYVQERLWARADDGTRVPLSVVRRADLPLDGRAGCLLYGYGAYEVSLTPSFSISRLSLLDRGYIVAIAHVRGGGELGRAWYYDGKLDRKENTFTDFVACARHLVEVGYTSAERLAIEGGSAGGLLIGAALNLAPDAFGAAHAAVPFVDPLTTILDPSLPLTVTEWEEWGDPLHDEAAYRCLRGYSPYENLRAGGYPPLLVTTSANDTRVAVTEPAKWVAALRARTGSRTEILLKTELDAGHGGVSGRYAAWRDDAFEIAWLIDRTGGNR